MDSHKYLFHRTCAVSYFDGLFGSSLISNSRTDPMCISGHFDTDKCDAIQKEVKEKQIQNFYFFFDENSSAVKCASSELSEVYVASCDEERWRQIGYLTDISKLTFQPQLFNRTFVDKYRDVMIVYDGSKIEEDLLPDDLKTMMSHTTGGGEVNPVPFVNHMDSEVGTVHVSSCNVGGLPQHAFCPMPSHISQIHFKEQWLSGSKDTKEEQYIGYIFKHDTYRLKAVSMMCRTGSHEQPALSAPVPRTLIIEGLLESGEWEGITDKLSFKKTDWKLFTPVSLDFSAHEAENTTFYKGFRVRVLDWFPGNKHDMLTGLMRVEFKCYENQAWTTPFYPVPHENIVYASFNSKLVGTAPKTVYPPTPEFVQKESERTITTPTTTDDTTIATIDPVLVGMDSSYATAPITLMEIKSHEIIWCDQDIYDLTEVMYQSNSAVLHYTLELINISSGDLWIRCNGSQKLKFLTPDKEIIMDRIGIDVGDCIRLHPRNGYWYIFYAGGNKSE